MLTEVEQAIFEKVKALRPTQPREVLRLVELLTREGEEAVIIRPNISQEFAKRLRKIIERPEKTIWEEIREIVEDVPDEVWEQLPRDGAENVDHYLYGAPKK